MLEQQSRTCRVVSRQAKWNLGLSEKVAHRHVFLQRTRLTVRHISQINILRHGFVCQKLHAKKGS